MGIERRHGRLYYYRKRREGDRVVSEYVGKVPADAVEALGGPAALTAERMAQARRRHALAQWAATDAALLALADRLHATARALLRQGGFHQHKGTWRHKRHERQPQP